MRKVGGIDAGSPFAMALELKALAEGHLLIALGRLGPEDRSGQNRGGRGGRGYDQWRSNTSSPLCRL